MNDHIGPGPARDRRAGPGRAVAGPVAHVRQVISGLADPASDDGAIILSPGGTGIRPDSSHCGPRSTRARNISLAVGHERHPFFGP